MKLDVGFDHACAIRDDGKAECWGDNRSGQAPALRAASNGGSFIQIAAGTQHTCALRDDETMECWGERRWGAGSIVLPTATFVAPASVVVKSDISLTLSNAQVPGHPSPLGFTYAFDCGTGSGYSAPSSVSTVACPTTTTGSRTVKGKVTDSEGDASEYTATVVVEGAAQSTSELVSVISTSTLSPDLRKALTAKLNAALDAIAKGKTAVACNALQDFINQVNAQWGKAIPKAVADEWLRVAAELRLAVGC